MWKRQCWKLSQKSRSLLIENWSSLQKVSIFLILCKFCFKNRYPTFSPVPQWVSEWAVFNVPPTQYRLYGRRFLQVKRPNQQYQSTEGESTKENNTKKHKENRKYTHTSIQITVTQTNTASSLVYNNMGWLGDSSHRGQGRWAGTAVGLPPRYPPPVPHTPN